MIDKVLKNIALVILSVFLIVYLTVQLKNIFIASIEASLAALTASAYNSG